MLAAVSGAKAAAKDAAGEAQRLAAVHATLEDAVSELSKGIEDTKLLDTVRKLLRKSKEASSELSRADAESAKKALHEKDVYWKLKLEAARSSIQGQLRTQALQLEDKHTTVLKTRLKEARTS